MASPPPAVRGETFITMFDKARQENGDQECYVSYDDKMGRQSITFRQLWDLASRFAHNLKQAGLQKGDAVVVTTPLSIEDLVASFGVIFAGGVHVSMDKFFAKCEMLIETINMMEAKFLLLTDSKESDIWPFFGHNVKLSPQNNLVGSFQDKEMPTLKTVLITNQGKDPQDPRGFLHHLRSCTAEYRDSDIDPEDGLACACSINPGMAVPKLVEHSHRSVVSTAKLYQRLFPSRTPVHFRWPWYIVVTLPFDALNGMARVITDNYRKITPEGYVKHTLDVINAEGLSMAVMGPPDIKGLADASASRGDTQGDKVVKEIISGGQPITKRIYEVAQQVSNKVHIMYCASETCFVSCNSLAAGDSFTPFDCGPLVEGVEVKILDENNQELPRGKTGRIAVRSPYLFTRYPGQPELTKSVWGADGWFYSDDAGCFRADGHLHVFGRRGDVISRGIVLTYPAWIEKPLCKISDVIDVMAVPVPDEFNFQNTCACVVLRPGSQLTENDLLRIYKEAVSSDKSDFFDLDHVLLFKDALPKLPRDKLGDLATEKLGLKQLQSKT